MGWFFKHKQVPPGGIFESQNQRQMAQTADWTAQMRASPPLSMTATANGPLLRLAGMLFSVYIAVVTADVGPRSGSTPGSGTVKVQTWNGTALADLAGPVTFTAYNFSSSGTGFAAGKYCVVLKIAGAYWIISAEC